MPTEVQVRVCIQKKLLLFGDSVACKKVTKKVSRGDDTTKVDVSVRKGCKKLGGKKIRAIAYAKFRDPDAGNIWSNEAKTTTDYAKYCGG